MDTYINDHVSAFVPPVTTDNVLPDPILDMYGWNLTGR